MSTDKSKKKRKTRRIERIKIIEYGSIALVVLLFLGLAILYGNREMPSEETAAEPTVSPVPTADTSIRGMHVFEALEGAGFTVSYQTDHYNVTAENGIVIIMRMQSDDSGIEELSMETYLCPDPEGESEVARLLRIENQKSLSAIQDFWDAVLPVFHRPVSDSTTIRKQCVTVVEKSEPYAKHIGKYSLVITTDPNETLQAVTVSLIRDS